MAVVIRVARDRAWEAAIPAAISWLMLFGYQWAFFLVYRGNQPTVFSYYSGVLGDGLIIPAVNVVSYIMLRELSSVIAWRRLPLYGALGLLTAFGAFLMQAHLNWVNWSMPAPFRWSDVGQFHFFVMSLQMTYMYVALATAVNNWKLLTLSPTAWRCFVAGWMGMALFALSLAADYIH